MEGEKSRFQQYKLPYYNEMMYFCMKNCFHQYMCFLGIKQPLLMMRTGYELKIMYFRKVNRFSTYRNELLMPFYDMNQVIYGSGDDEEALFKENCKHLPLIVLVDVYYLPHREEYHTYHASHVVFMEDYKEETDQVCITDWYHPYFYRGEMSREEFMEARSSLNPKDKNPFSGTPIKNYWYKVDKDRLQIDIPKNIMKNMEGIKGKKEDPKRNFILTGVNAIDKIIEVIDTELQKKEGLSEFCIGLHDEMFIWQRAADLSRVFYREAKTVYPELVDDSFLQFIEEGYKNLSDVNFYLMKAGMSRTERNLERSVDKIKEYRQLHDKTFG